MSVSVRSGGWGSKDEYRNPVRVHSLAREQRVKHIMPARHGKYQNGGFQLGLWELRGETQEQPETQGRCPGEEKRAGAWGDGLLSGRKKWQGVPRSTAKSRGWSGAR